MAAGISKPIAGKSAFLAIKFLGYTAAAVKISKAYNRSDLNPWLVGGVRTLIGGVVALLLSSGQFLPKEFAYLKLIIFLVLIPSRPIEWWLLIRIFYDRSFSNRQLGLKVIFWGTLWSFALDIPAFVGFLIFGELWIC